MVRSPGDVSFDKVVSQQLGPPQPGVNSLITFEYHDFAIEARQRPIYSSEEHWAGPYSTPNPLVVNPLLPSSTWVAEDLCRRCATRRCLVAAARSPTT